MAKTFQPRKPKKERVTLAFEDKMHLFRASDKKLLKGARLDEIKLADIRIKEQVRTKFNDSSLQDLAENIQQNGLIQPLVLHLEKNKYTLICGERRYRAMAFIKMKKAPCFVLENKSKEELMAIQFSENTSREALHYVDRADGILNYQKATKASERKIVAALGISKTEVHRSLLLAKLSPKIKDAAKLYNIEKYVLLEFDALAKGKMKDRARKEILSGNITKRTHLKALFKNPDKKKTTRKSPPSMPKGLTANAFLKALNHQTKNKKIDSETKKLLKSLVQETQNLMNP